MAISVIYSLCFNTPWYKEGNTIMKNGGIYIIRNTETNKFYLGSSKDLRKRYQKHRKPLLTNKHYNLSLQHSFSKHGPDKFYFEIIEIVNDNSLLQREQYWLDVLTPYNNLIGYNITNIAGPTMNTGKSPSQETRNRISRTLIEGHYVSPRKGITLSAETRNKISTSVLDLKLKGNKLPQSKPVIIENISDGIKSEFESITSLGISYNMDRATIRKYAISGDLYKNTFKIIFTNGK